MNNLKLAWLRFCEFFRAFERKQIARLLLIVGLAIGLTLAAVEYFGGNKRQIDNVIGVVESGTPQLRRPAPVASVTVKLDGGRKVVFELQENQPYIPNARVELRVWARESFGGTYFTYHFERYLDEAGEPSR